MIDNFELFLRVAKVFNGFDGPGPDQLWWRTDEEYAPLSVFADCNDVFVWACADNEEITAENIDILEQSLKDLQAVANAGHNSTCEIWAGVLFACRIRKMRPQGAFYKLIDKEAWSLFDSCGPERETGFGNPF